MNIYRFINSQDIREHLKEIGYAFSSLEAAWLIYQCRTASLAEKHAAWQEIIENMPDCKIEERLNTQPRESLHAFLKEYMEFQNKCKEEFYRADGHAIYQYRCVYNDSGDWCDGETVFSSFDACCQAIQTEEEDVRKIAVRKRRVDESFYLEGIMLPDKTLLSVEPSRIDNEYEYDLYRQSFDGFWFDFPVPFQKGDILWDPAREGGFCGGPFVMEGIALEGISSERAKENLRKHGDNSDMNAWGIFQQEEDGVIYSEVTWNYMDCEYYRGELTGKRRILTALSNFVKGRIDVCLFARAYHQILAEERAKDCMPSCYTKEGMILAGLAQQEHRKIWLDDARKAPDGYVHCHSVNEAKEQILQCEKECIVIDLIDCDHDLGDYAQDGGDGIRLIDWLAERKTCYPIALHTMNPVGRETMQREIDRYWGG